MPLHDVFENLPPDGYRITSESTSEYNCFAWAAGDTQRWWEPDPFEQYYWPVSAPRSATLESYKAAYATLGYTDCESESLDSGIDKIAVFVNELGFPSHASRQLPNGRWTSKCGQAEDIEHDLRDLEGRLYGKVVCFMKRKV